LGFSATIIEILIRDNPYPTVQMLQVATLVSRGELKPTCPEGTNTKIVELVEKCTKFDANERFDFERICEFVENWIPNK